MKWLCRVIPCSITLDEVVYTRDFGDDSWYVSTRKGECRRCGAEFRVTRAVIFNPLKSGEKIIDQKVQRIDEADDE